MAKSKPSQTAKNLRNSKSNNSLKRPLENEPEDAENANQNGSHDSPVPKRRSKIIPPPTSLDTGALPSVDAQESSPAVSDGPPKRKQKPGPKPGFKFPTEAEAPPAWSWDITGDWTVDSPGLMESLEFDDSDPLTMTIHLANNPRHTKIGRQFWANFNFGECLVGTMRFCPYRESHVRDDLSLDGFEKACVLKQGVWVGPAPNGLRKWNLRWRGVNFEERVMEGGSDQIQTNIDFNMNEDGRLTLEAVFMYRFSPIALRAVKTGEGRPPWKRDPTVTNRWLQYKAKYI